MTQELPPQLCNKGCGATVILRKVAEGWRPFEESGKMHDCPNSPYNLSHKKTEQQGQQLTENGKKILEQNLKENGKRRLNIKILKSFDSEDLERQYNKFAYPILFSTYCPVAAGDRIQERICVYYDPPHQQED